ncbi:hypothetical protein [Clostridium perfringens]|uniref:hypothetical protein n=1 Tax=Clostridium perfringens TaxID=1502 RepID=UPI003F429782
MKCKKIKIEEVLPKNNSNIKIDGIYICSNKNKNDVFLLEKDSEKIKISKSGLILSIGKLGKGKKFILNDPKGEVNKIYK